MSKNQEKIEIVRARALKRVGIFKRAFSTPDGKKALKELVDEFGSSAINIPGDPFGTHVRVGNIEVLRYIHDIMEVEEDG